MARVNLPLCFVAFFLYVAVCSGSDVSDEDRNLPGTWCVSNPGADGPTLQGAIDYCCSQPGVDCGTIQAGGSCFDPNTLVDHADVALNLFFKAHGAFRQYCPSDSGIITLTNPSHGSCIFP